MTGLVANLLKGSRAIDQMRRDIPEFITMIVGVVQKSAEAGVRPLLLNEHIMVGSNYKWVARARLGRKDSDANYFRIFGKFLPGGKTFTFLQMGRGEKEELRADDIASLTGEELLIVYRALDMLIVNFASHVPTFGEKLEVFGKAARVTLAPRRWAGGTDTPLMKATNEILFKVTMSRMRR